MKDWPKCLLKFEEPHRQKIAQMITDLEARNQDLERFASVAAHQLRSPPRTIAGIAQALKEDYEDVLGEKGVQFLQDIRQNAEQMAEIVDGLYRFSTVRTSEAIAVSPVDLNEVLSHIASGVEHELVVDDLPVVVGDQVLLTELFSNLIDNGFKFNESNPKRVSITAELREDQRWEIRVRDNGIGIDPRYQPKLFTMFQRVHTGYAGTGVGLALVAAIVHKLGGSISVNSVPGEGTEFTFDLPGG